MGQNTHPQQPTGHRPGPQARGGRGLTAYIAAPIAAQLGSRQRPTMSLNLFDSDKRGRSGAGVSERRVRSAPRANRRRVLTCWQ